MTSGSDSRGRRGDYLPAGVELLESLHGAQIGPDTPEALKVDVLGNASVEESRKQILDWANAYDTLSPPMRVALNAVLATAAAYQGVMIDRALSKMGADVIKLEADMAEFRTVASRIMVLQLAERAAEWKEALLAEPEPGTPDDRLHARSSVWLLAMRTFSVAMEMRVRQWLYAHYPEKQWWREARIRVMVALPLEGWGAEVDREAAIRMIPRVVEKYGTQHGAEGGE